MRSFSKLYENPTSRRILDDLKVEVGVVLFVAGFVAFFSIEIQNVIHEIPIFGEFMNHILIGIGVFISLIAVVILLKIMFSKLWSSFYDLVSLDKTHRQVLEPLLIARLNELSEKITPLFQTEGGQLEESEAEELYETLFLFSGAKTFRGTERHVPSVFMKKRERYLKAHKKFLEKNKKQQPKDERILIVNKEELDKDLQINPEPCKQFIEWHNTNNVSLFQEGPRKADEHLHKNKHFEKIFLQNAEGTSFGELGIWYDKYILLFNRDKYDKYKIRAHILTSDKKEYEEGIDYYEALINESLTDSLNPQVIKDHLAKHPDDHDYIKDFTREERESASERFIKIYRSKIVESLVKPKINSFGKLSKNSFWEDYVACPDRLEKTECFLNEILSKFSDRKETKILDAGGGVPCESDSLAKNGYSVKYNEFDQDLYSIGYKHISKNPNIDREYMNINWSQLSNYFEKREEFDVVLALGNFLSLGLDRKQISDYLLNFYEILRPNGLLIVDQRNFDKVRAYLSEMKTKGVDPGPETFYDQKYYSGNNTMFCGKKIKGWPVKENVDNEIIKSRCGESNRIIEFVYGESVHQPIDSLYMYGFEKGEMRDLLKKAGFKDNGIKIYSDLSRDKPDLEHADADFYTFVATKL